GEVVTLKDGNPDSIVPGLMAVGETGCVSVHGANRLGSNSLLDLVVFGRAAAHRCEEVVPAGKPHRADTSAAEERALDRFDRLRHADGDTSTAELRDSLQHSMQKHAAVFRSTDTLKEGVEQIGEEVQAFANVGVTD